MAWRLLLPAYLAVGAVAVAAYFALPGGPQAILYVCVGVSAAAALCLGARHYLPRARARLPWYLFALGLATQSAGDATFSYFELIRDALPEHASSADVLYLAGYPALIAGVALLVRRVGPAGNRVSLVDAAIVTASVALIQWVFLMEPLVRDGELTAVDRVVYLAYPAMDLLLFAALARFFATPVRQRPAYVLLSTSVLLLLVADEIYGGTSSSYVSGSWLDGLWLLSYLAWGAAALHPSMREVTLIRDDTRPALSGLRLFALGAALLVVPALLVVERATDHAVDGLALAVGGAVLGGLVLLRLAVLVRGIEGLTESERIARAEAETAQRLLTEQNDRLRELDRLKDEFVASVSHDLRTPLTSIAGYVELLSEDADELDEERRGFLRVVSRNADRLMTLVDDLLFVARLQSGGVQLTSSDVDLAELAEECIESVSPRADGKGVALILEAEGRPVVPGDRRRLAQVLDNLVANAVKFTGDGGRVILRVRAGADDASIEVADSGIGIPAEETARLFDPFFRASTAVDRQIPGTGLGLHIAKAIVAAHGGRIGVTSAEGVGTTFRVELRALAGSERVQISDRAAV